MSTVTTDKVMNALGVSRSEVTEEQWIAITQVKSLASFIRKINSRQKEYQKIIEPDSYTKKEYYQNALFSSSVALLFLLLGTTVAHFGTMSSLSILISQIICAFFFLTLSLIAVFYWILLRNRDKYLEKRNILNFFIYLSLRKNEKKLVIENRNTKLSRDSGAKLISISREGCREYLKTVNSISKNTVLVNDKGEIDIFQDA